MITRSQTRNGNNQDENQCPNNKRSSISDKSPHKSPLKSPLKSSTSSIKGREAASARKKQQQKQWPSVKSLREKYEPRPSDNNGALKIDRVVVEGGRWRRCSYDSSSSRASSSSSSAYRRQYDNRSASRCKQEDAVGVDSKKKYELRSKLRRVSDPVETTTLSSLSTSLFDDDGSIQKKAHDEGAVVASVAQPSSEYSRKEDIAATIKEEDSADDEDISELQGVGDPVETTTLSTVSASLIDDGSTQKQTHNEVAAVTSSAKSSSEYSGKEEVAAASKVCGSRINEKENAGDEVLEPTMVQQKKETIATSPTTLSFSDNDGDDAGGVGIKQGIRSKLQGLNHPAESTTLSTVSASLFDDGSTQKQTYDKGAADASFVANSSSECSGEEDIAAAIKEEETDDEEEVLEPTIVQEDEIIACSPTTLSCSEDDVVAGVGSKHEMRSKLRRVNDPVETTILPTLSASFLIDDGSSQKKAHDEGAVASVAQSSSEYSRKEDSAATIKEEDSADQDVSEPTMVQQEKETVASSPTTLSCSDDDDDAGGVGDKQGIRSKLQGLNHPVETTTLSTVSASLFDDGSPQKQTHDEGATDASFVANSSSECSGEEDIAAAIKEEETDDEEEVLEPTIVQEDEIIACSPTTLSCSDDDDDDDDAGVGSKHEMRSKLRRVNDPVETTILPTLSASSLIDDGSSQKKAHDEGAVASVAQSSSAYSRKEDSAATIKEEDSADQDVSEPTMVQQEKENIASSSTTLSCSDDDDDDAGGVGIKQGIRSKLRLNHPVDTTTLSTVSASLFGDGSMQKQTHDEGAADASFVANSSSKCSGEEDIAATIKEEEDSADEEEVLEPTMVQEKEIIACSPTALSCSKDDDAAGVGSKHEMRSKLRRVNDPVETTTLPTLSASSLIDDGSIQKQTHDEGAADASFVAKSSSECSKKEDVAATTEVNGSKVEEDSADDEEEVLEPTMVQQKKEAIASSPTTLSCSEEDDVAGVVSKHEMRSKLQGVNDPLETTTLPTLSTSSLIDDGSTQKQTHDEGAADASIAKSSSECIMKEDFFTITKVNGSTRINEKENAIDEVLGPTMVQQKKETIASSPTALSCSDDYHEMRSSLRSMSDHVEVTTLSTLSAFLIDDGSTQKQTRGEGAVVASVAKSSSKCSGKEEVAAATKGSGEGSADEEEVLEPTMTQQKKETIASSPTALPCSDDSKELTVDTMTQDVVSQCEGRRLKSNQTVADDEDMIDDGVEEEAAVMEEKEMDCIEVQEEPAVMEEKETDCIQLQEEPAVMKKEMDWILLQEEPAAETKMKNPTSSNNCEEEIIPSKSTSKTTVLVVKPECSTTSSIGAYDILDWLSQLALSGLTLFGIYHRYTLAQTTSSQGPVEDIGSPLWHQILHVVLVFALSAKAVYKSTEAAVCKDSRMQKAVCFMRHLMIWTVTIPLFHKCNFGAKNLCVFPTHQSSASACIPNYSIFDIAVTNSYHALLSLLKTIIKSKLLNQVFREIQRALFNPFKFHARVQKALVILKWAKFIGPLIGTCNKFRGNLIDMARKRRQHRVSKAALKRWYFAIDALSKQSKSEQAVVQLQKAFRERRVEKTKKRQLLMANRRWVRSKLEEEERLNRTKLEQIERRDIDRQQRRQVSSEERHGIVQHKKSARKLMKQLLLNPKTYFSVIWKYLTVSCVALEIMTILFAPALSGEVKKMPLDQFIVKVLRGSRPQCNKSARDAPSLFPYFGSMSDITCSGSKIEQTAHIIAIMIVPAVNWICFLDVFITFFTGELSSTGTLEPKPFFQRWVLPGPVLQLIVNPTMVSIKIALCNAFGTSIKIGPSLCLHSFLACRVFAAYLYDRLFECILDIIEKVNEFNAQTKGQDYDDDLHWT